MSIAVFGISHKTAPLAVREKFSLTKKDINEALLDLKNFSHAQGAIILSTCNRLEIYLHMDRESRIREARERVLNICRATAADMERYFYVLTDRDAIRHLFRVASGLDSQVLGEMQILGQVRDGWEISRGMNMTNPALDGIFMKAVELGSLVRSRTGISRGNISIGSAAIKMLEDRVGRLDKSSCLIVGAGKISGLMTNYLKERNINAIFVASRRYPAAVELASRCGGRAVDFTRLEEELRGVDIVISSTSSPHLILKYETLCGVMIGRSKPLFIMDLALPRDIDPRARLIRGISLYDLDDLKSVIEENYKTRQEGAGLAEALIEKNLAGFIFRNEKLLSERQREEVIIDV